MTDTIPYTLTLEHRGVVFHAMTHQPAAPGQCPLDPKTLQPGLRVMVRVPTGYGLRLREAVIVETTGWTQHQRQVGSDPRWTWARGGKRATGVAVAIGGAPGDDENRPSQRAWRPRVIRPVDVWCLAKDYVREAMKSDEFRKRWNDAKRERHNAILGREIVEGLKTAMAPIVTSKGMRPTFRKVKPPEYNVNAKTVELSYQHAQVMLALLKVPRANSMSPPRRKPR